MAPLHPARIVLKWATLVLFIGTGLFAVGTLVLFLVVRAESSKQAPLQTGPVAGVPGLFAIEDRGVNFYLLKRGAQLIAFDAGRDPRANARALDSLGLDAQSVTAVFLTHSDSDHCGGAGLFSNARVYLSRAEEPLATGKIRRLLAFKNAYFSEHTALDDGQTVPVEGLAIQAIATPGHTPGSLCFLAGDTLLFAGDTLALYDGKAAVFSDLFNMSSARQKRSLHRLSALTHVVFAATGHHGVTGRFQEAIASWR
ncbi:MAG: MBL fold metallo-hydrolase [Spirochaetes bacterium]|nr:MBL fold metallo-hydrolase [Spirochaetota bacterium]